MATNDSLTLLTILCDHRELINPVYNDLKDYMGKKGYTTYNLESATDKINYIVNTVSGKGTKDPKILGAIIKTIDAQTRIKK